MARTHKTAQIKAQMAEKARIEEEEARRREEARIAGLDSARTRSEKAGALVRACERQNVGSTDSSTSGAKAPVVNKEPDAKESAEDEADKEEDEDKEENEEEEAEGELEEKPPASRDTKGKKRTFSDVEDEELVRVSAFKKEHDSWASLEVSLREYMNTTHQKIVIKEVIHTARRNAALRSQVRFKGRSDSEIPLVPAELEPYQRKYICTHGWSERERSTEKRTSQALRRTDCPFQILAQLTKKTDGSWCVSIKREVSADSPLMPGVELLVEAQAGTSSVYDYIRSNSNHCVTMDDVRSMISRLRSVELSDNDAVSEMIVEFNLESSKNVSTVNENARGDTGVISFTSGHMRAMLDSFPEVIQLDCTHKTNQYNYQLLSMVAMDQYGQGQPIQYSLLETNSDWNMAKALDHFKRANERWKSVRIVIVDKAMKEIDVIRQKLPKARILLCHFHVIKWLHNTIRNSRKFGVYEEEVLVQMRHNINNMTYARTVADYEKYRGEFEHLACR
ncbi:hypothetical protein F443_19466, partial [Phytophthora nicotianae P1569]